MRCTAHSRSGSQCKSHALPGTNVCRMHGGKAPQVQDAARRRLLEAVDPIMAELIRLAQHADSESVRVQAARDALDRAGYGVRQQLEQTVTTHDGDADALEEIEQLKALIAERAEGRDAGGPAVAGDGTT